MSHFCHFAASLQLPSRSYSIANIESRRVMRQDTRVDNHIHQNHNKGRRSLPGMGPITWRLQLVVQARPPHDGARK